MRADSLNDPLVDPFLTKSYTVSQFSSKAKRRRNEQLTSQSQKVKHSTESVVAMEDDTNIAELMECSKGDEVDLGLGDGIRPVPDLKAKAPEMMYDWDAIIPKEVLTALDPMAEEISGATVEVYEDWKKTKRFSPFVIKLFLEVPKGAPDRNERIALAACVGYLFRLSNFPMKPVYPDAVLPAGAPPAVLKYFVETFTVKSHVSPKQRIFTAKIKDKILAHTLLWILKAQNFSSDISLLTSELRVRERSKIIQIASIIGARCSEKESKGQSLYALTLRHPWTFPKMSAGTPRKKRRT